MAPEVTLIAAMVKRDAKEPIKISVPIMDLDTCGASTKASCMEKSAIPLLTSETNTVPAATTAMVV